MKSLKRCGMHPSDPARKSDPSTFGMHRPMVSQRWSSVRINTKFGFDSGSAFPALARAVGAKREDANIQADRNASPLPAADTTPPPLQASRSLPSGNCPVKGHPPLSRRSYDPFTRLPGLDPDLGGEHGPFACFRELLIEGLARNWRLFSSGARPPSSLGSSPS